MAGPTQAVRRVVSLLPAATEIVAALGAAGELVARSHECDFPASVGDLPAVSAPRIDPARPSAAIEADVRARLEAALSIYRIDATALRDARPDLIVTQTMCDVCAVSPADVEAALAEWTGARPRIVALAPATLADVLGDIGRVAAALGRAEAGASLAAQMRTQMDEIAARCAGANARPSVATIEWLDPPMAGGNWMPELVGMAGGRNLFGAPGAHSPWLDPEALAAADPDIVLVVPCGFGIARTRTELDALADRPWLRALRGRIVLADGNRYFNRPGPRLVESLEILAEILHPEICDYGHRDDGYADWKQADGNR
ncbi:MAG: ABC transporter substrate-binding protein [Rhodospirillales bacterium]|nr:ABC transporter substrate-binding protein [Rhodospirillales bacterium]